jgi:hypothetical protein
MYTLPGNILAMTRAARTTGRTGSSEVTKMDAKFSAEVKDLLGKRGLKKPTSPMS